MADRVIQRNDTAARWQSINPILATGEIGIEIDGAKGYKIGDGKTRWNDLPYPANPTNVVQELGNDENAVPSQKLVTEKLSELGSEIESLGRNLYKDDTQPTDLKSVVSNLDTFKTGMVVRFFDGWSVVEYQLMNENYKNERCWVKYGSGFNIGYIDNTMTMKSSTPADWTYHHKVVPVKKGGLYQISYYDALYSNAVSIVTGYDIVNKEYTRIYFSGGATSSIKTKTFKAEDDYIIVSVPFGIDGLDYRLRDWFNLEELAMEETRLSMDFPTGSLNSVVRNVPSEKRVVGLSLRTKEGVSIYKGGDFEDLINWETTRNNFQFKYGYVREDLTFVLSGAGFYNYIHTEIEVEIGKTYRLTYTPNEYDNIVSNVTEVDNGGTPLRSLVLGLSSKTIRSVLFCSDVEKVVISIPSNSSFNIEQLNIEKIDLSQRPINGSFRVDRSFDEKPYQGNYKTIKNVPVIRGHYYMVEFKGETYSSVVSVVTSVEHGNIVGTQIQGRRNDGEVNYATFKAINDSMHLSYPYNYISLYDLGCELTFDKIVLFGDSITEEWNTTEGDYVNRVVSKFNCSTVVKKGFGGYTLSGEVQSTSLTSKVSEVVSENPQLVMMLAGTNDIGNSKVLGSYTDDASNAGTACAGLKYIVNKIMEGCDSNLLYCLPLPRVGYDDVKYKYVSELLKTIYQYKIDNPNYSDRIMVLDSYSYSMFDVSVESNSATRVFTTDGLHLSCFGYERLTDLQKIIVNNTLKGVYFRHSYPSK